MGRRHMPEAGQQDHAIPIEWAERLEEEIVLQVKAPLREWANFLMVPIYPTLRNYNSLTTNFRNAFLAITHDFMLRRLKKGTLKYTRDRKSTTTRDIIQ